MGRNVTTREHKVHDTNGLHISAPIIENLDKNPKFGGKKNVTKSAENEETQIEVKRHMLEEDLNIDTSTAIDSEF